MLEYSDETKVLRFLKFRLFTHGHEADVAGLIGGNFWTEDDGDIVLSPCSFSQLSFYRRNHFIINKTFEKLNLNILSQEVSRKLFFNTLTLSKTPSSAACFSQSRVFFLADILNI